MHTSMLQFNFFHTDQHKSPILQHQLNLEKKEFFATLMKDDSPQTTPVWVYWEKGTNTNLINTAEGRLKYKNISRDARVSRCC